MYCKSDKRIENAGIQTAFKKEIELILMNI